MYNNFACSNAKSIQDEFVNCNQSPIQQNQLDQPYVHIEGMNFPKSGIPSYDHQDKMPSQSEYHIPSRNMQPGLWNLPSQVSPLPLFPSPPVPFSNSNQGLMSNAAHGQSQYTYPNYYQGQLPNPLIPSYPPFIRGPSSAPPLFSVPPNSITNPNSYSPFHLSSPPFQNSYKASATTFPQSSYRAQTPSTPTASRSSMKSQYFQNSNSPLQNFNKIEKHAQSPMPSNKISSNMSTPTSENYFSKLSSPSKNFSTPNTARAFSKQRDSSPIEIILDKNQQDISLDIEGYDSKSKTLLDNTENSSGKYSGRSSYKNRSGSFGSTYATVEVVGIEDLDIVDSGKKTLKSILKNGKEKTDIEISSIDVAVIDSFEKEVAAAENSSDSIFMLGKDFTKDQSKNKIDTSKMVVCLNCGISEDWKNSICSRCKRDLHKDIKESKKIPVNNKDSLSAKGNKHSKMKELHPEILTLSSDEEESCKALEVYMKQSFEDSSSEKDSYLSGGGLSDKGSNSCQSFDIEDEFVSIPSCLIRVGTYEAIPHDRVLFSKGYIVFTLPSVKKSSALVGEKIKIQMKVNWMVKILANLDNNSNSVVLLYVRPSPAAIISKLLRFSENSACVFDPVSKNPHELLILIHLSNIPEDDRESIVDFYSTTPYGDDFFALIDDDMTNHLLLKYIPQDQITENFEKLDAQTLLIYPPEQNSGGITISTADYYCLEEEQFLNDVILDFYLRYLFLEKLSVSDRNRTHIFSTFFYKRLTSKPKKRTESNSVSLTAAQIRHARVKSWTKNTDIFEKDFIIIPINDQSHWYLAIVCFPGLTNLVGAIDKVSTRNGPPSNSTKKAEEKIPLIDDLDTDKDEAEGDDEEMNPDCDDEPPSKKLKNDFSLMEQSCIMIFDSLSGSPRSKIVATIRDYLHVEHLEKKKSTKVFSKDTMKGVCMSVPQQTNFSDCGLFTLQYAESFFERPIKNFHLPQPKLSNWFSQYRMNCKREEIANLIQTLMDKYRPGHDIKLPRLFFNSQLIEKVKPESVVDENASKEIIHKVTLTEDIIKPLLQKEQEIVKQEEMLKIQQEMKKKQQEVNLEEAPTKQIVIGPKVKRIKVTLVDKTQKAPPKRPPGPVPFWHESTTSNAKMDDLFMPSSHLSKAISSRSISLNPICVIDDNEEGETSSPKTPPGNDIQPCSDALNVIAEDECDKNDIIFESAHYKPTFGGQSAPPAVIPDDEEDDEVCLVDPSDSSSFLNNSITSPIKRR